MPKDREVPSNPFEHWQHVEYEVRRLALDQLVAMRASDRVKDSRLSETERWAEQDMVNRALEAALLHIRNVADLLECRGEQPGDMHAQDFLVVSTSWKPPAKGTVLTADTRDRLNREVNHLTYKRHGDDQADQKLWPAEVAERVLSIAREFFEAVGRPFPQEALTFFEIYRSRLTVNAAGLLCGVPTHTAPSLATQTVLGTMTRDTLSGPITLASTSSASPIPSRPLPETPADVVLVDPTVIK